MNTTKTRFDTLTGMAALAACALGAAPAHAGGSGIWFTPLTESAPVVAPNDLAELAAPWATPEGILQTNLLSLREVEDQVLSPMQSIVRVPAGSQGSMIDMIAYDPSGEFLFLPHETPFGAGVSRHDIQARVTEVLFQGDQKGQAGDWSHDYGAFDPCRFTPNDTLFLAEEWAGQGRVIEVLNPFAEPADIQVRELDSIANVAHEGITFSKQDPRVIYFVDEYNSGSIYKFVMSRPGDYTRGQTFVLKVDAFAGNVTEDYNSATNASQPRTGPATWVPLTNAHGKPLPGIANPFDNAALGGRTAADDAGGTPYGRPEDTEIGRLRNGREVVYFAATSENTVYSIEIGRGDKAVVRTLFSRATPKNVGFPATTGEIDSPDNLAQDALGNIYIVEDAPNGSNVGGDIWFARDADNDGIAESVDHFMSIRADGCEATGMIFNPAKPTEFVVAVQHPDSTDLAQVPNGLGDAVWRFDLSTIDNKAFLKRLEKAGRPRHKHDGKDW
ncbi:MAG TPA: alkaline phosphatase PhoX [Opitutaceae bacterium]